MFTQVLFGLLMILCLLVSVSDPGLIKSDPSMSFDKLLTSCEPSSLCPVCVVRAYYRTRGQVCINHSHAAANDLQLIHPALTSIEALLSYNHRVDHLLRRHHLLQRRVGLRTRARRVVLLRPQHRLPRHQTCATATTSHHDDSADLLLPHHAHHLLLLLRGRTRRVRAAPAIPATRGPTVACRVSGWL